MFYSFMLVAVNDTISNSECNNSNTYNDCHDSPKKVITASSRLLKNPQPIAVTPNSKPDFISDNNRRIKIAKTTKPKPNKKSNKTLTLQK